MEISMRHGDEVVVKIQTVAGYEGPAIEREVCIDSHGVVSITDSPSGWGDFRRRAGYVIALPEDDEEGGLRNYPAKGVTHIPPYMETANDR